MFQMPKSLLAAAIVGGLAFAGSPSANAFIDLSIPGFSAVLPDPFSITFDENGKGSYGRTEIPRSIP